MQEGIDRVGAGGPPKTYSCSTSWFHSGRATMRSRYQRSSTASRSVPGTSSTPSKASAAVPVRSASRVASRLASPVRTAAAHSLMRRPADCAWSVRKFLCSDTTDMGTLKGFALPFGPPRPPPPRSLPPSGTSGPTPSPPHPLASLAPDRSASPVPPAVVRGEQSSPAPLATTLTPLRG